MASSLQDIDLDDLTNVSPQLLPSPIPTKFVSLVADADALLLVKEHSSSEDVIALGVSFDVVRVASLFFAAELALSLGAQDTQWASKRRQLPWIDVTREGHSHIWTLCMNIMHLQNDVLPVTLDAQRLSMMACLASRYCFVAAISWWTANWFDHIYFQDREGDLIDTIEAAMLLDHPIYFARFTARLLLYHRLPYGTQIPPTSTWSITGLTDHLHKRRQTARNIVRKDMEFLLEPVGAALSTTERHFVDSKSDSDDDYGYEQDRAALECTFDLNTGKNEILLMSVLVTESSYALPFQPQ